MTRAGNAMKQSAKKVVPGPAAADTDSRPAEPGRRIRARRRGSGPIRVNVQLAQTGRSGRLATSEGITGSGMQFTDVAQLSTQSQIPAGPFQSHGQGLSVEDAAAGVARPARHRKIWRRRASGSSAGHQGGPRSGSSARLGCPSQDVILLGVPIGAGDSTSAGPRRERRPKKGSAGSNLAHIAIIAARVGTAGGRGLREGEALALGSTRSKRRRLGDRHDPLRPGDAGGR